MKQLNHLKNGLRHSMIKKSLDEKTFMNKFSRKLPKETTDSYNMKIPLLDHSGIETRK